MTDLFYYTDDDDNLYEGSPQNGGSSKKIDSNVVYVSFAGDKLQGYLTTAYIKKDGSLWGFGRGTEGQLARGSRLNVTNPVQIAGQIQVM